MTKNFITHDIARVRRSFLEGEPLSPGLLPQSLIRSWERTAAAGIRPADRMLFGQSVSSEEARRVADEHKMMIDIASGDLLSLWSSMRSPNWVVLLTNADGTILHSLGQHDHAPREICLPLQPGRRLPECEMGTNAPAVVMSELESFVVQGQEHFLDELSHFSCAAAPVFNLDGRLAGILDATGYDAALDPRALHRVSLAARSIENRLFEATTEGLLFGLHEDPRFIGTPLQGLILVREDGRLLTANKAAKEMLHLSQNFVQQGQVISVEDLFEGELYKAMANVRGMNEQAAVVRTTSGTRFYVQLLRQPNIRVNQPSVRIASTPAAELDLETLLDRGGRVFRKGLPVLLQGETGTGKEWFARRLHEAHRPDQPFVAINCSAIAESLAEAELFGYEEGAYTGGRKGGASGKIEAAQGGTLFLDEIGDMPLTLQTRLLRTLQERVNVRLGSQKELKLDILVVSATHRDLQSMVKNGQFREDLYFRLNGLNIPLPSLRVRKDLSQLMDLILEELSDADTTYSVPFQIRLALLNYDWPGNIRQLRHVLEVACALAGEEGVVELDSLPVDIQQLCSSESLADVVVDDVLVPDMSDCTFSALKEEWVNSALAKHNGNVSAAAKELGVSRTTLYKYLRR
jgi:transcriptional regulator of acetoin/glycerol metabolism